jgi:hypothetical protein
VSTSINVNKQSVKELLSSGAVNKFVIPEYQRPYAWTEDEVETLFNDLLEFTRKSLNHKDQTYFLGSVVSYTNENGEQEIIDGQQRITSLFLLLRAIYTKLQEPQEKTDEAQNFISKIEETIWQTNNLTGKIDDFGNILIESKVINNAGNEILRNILKTGVADPKARDHYSLNYRKFQELYNKASADDALLIFDFVYNLLNRAILLPITADNQDTALTIFSTLNNRGLALSDADIFKATIYNQLDADAKKEFIRNWQTLDEDAKNADQDIQSLFYYYMFYIRGLENDDSTTTPGIRKYFIDKHEAALFDPELLSKLTDILNLWRVCINREKIQDEAWSEDSEILRSLDVLSSYPNEFWKYPVITYYLSHKTEPNFIDNFRLFLNRLAAELVTRYIVDSSINFVKSDIMKLNVDTVKNIHPIFAFKDLGDTDPLENIKKPNSKSVRMLLKVLAYSYQEELLPQKWEIEHIFPQKWHSNYFPKDISDDQIREKIELLGNKVPFEKKLNIQAGNEYFVKKKGEYAQSKIAVAKALCAYSDWSLDTITERGSEIAKVIKKTLDRWVSDYTQPDGKPMPTPEELEVLKKYSGYKFTE